jgi:hypothetical protein
MNFPRGTTSSINPQKQADLAWSEFWDFFILRPSFQPASSRFDSSPIEISSKNYEIILCTLSYVRIIIICIEPANILTREDVE